MVIRISPNRVSLEDARLERATLKYCAETTQTINANTASTNIDIQNGNVIYLNQSADTTISFNNPTASPTSCTVTIIRAKDYGVTARNITWPASFRWANGNTPTLTQTSLGVDIIEATTIDGGTTWQARIIGLNMQYKTAQYGYFAGGTYTGPVYADAFRITFSTSVIVANTISNLSVARWGLAGVSDGVNYGYFAGGGTDSGSNSPVTTADRITFSTGARNANAASNLSQARAFFYALGDGSTYGYFTGGNTGAYVATVDRIVFSTGATAANSVSQPTYPNLSQPKIDMACVSDGTNYGYCAGGSTTGGGLSATFDRIVFATGAVSAYTTYNLTQARTSPGGVSDGAVYGYFLGGYVGGGVTTADRITYSNGAVAANTVSRLSQARGYAGCLSDGASYGYIAGGWSVNAQFNTVDRIVFSTGATAANTASGGSNLPVSGRGYLAGLSEFKV
jgi:hypothetical protein